MQTNNINTLKPALDAILFVSSTPISLERISEILEISLEEAKSLILERQQEFNSNDKFGLQIVINENGVQLATKPIVAQYIQKYEGQKLVNLSIPALETLAIIAYKQPITKSEIEEIRGVNCDGVINTLLEKKLIYISGEKQVAGRPKLYSTTQDFLYYFGLKSISELPPIPTEFISITTNNDFQSQLYNNISNPTNQTLENLNDFEKNRDFTNNKYEKNLNTNNLNDSGNFDDSNNKS